MTDWADERAQELWDEDIAWRVFQGCEDDGKDLKEVIAAALREARAMGPEWQDISTAPLMKAIMLFAVTDAETGNWKIGTGWWREGYQSAEGCWIWEGREVKEYETQPTHWQPLPAAPKES